MRVLVTGGSGFVGAHVARYVARTHVVVAPPRAELDLLDSAAVDRAFSSPVDVVIHCAVRGGPDVLASTLTMHRELMRKRDRWKRMIWLGSGAEFAKHRDIRRVREAELGEVTPRDPYGLAKLYCTLASEDPAITNARLFGVFGPGEGHLYKFISNAVVKALIGQPIRIRQDCAFSYLWIGDFVRIVAALLESGDAPLPHVNVVPDEVVRLTELACIVRDQVAARTGRPVVVTTDEAGLNREYTADNALLRRHLPDVAFTPVSVAIGELVDHYIRELPAIDVAAVLADDYARRIQTRAPA